MTLQALVFENTDITLKIEARSVLYHLEPIGVGTPYVESLSSYLKRLAWMHHLRVNDLVAFVSEQFSEDDLPPSWTRTQHLFSIDYANEIGTKWSQMLSKLTDCSEVTYLTMAYWKPIVNSYGELRKQQAWCPKCYSVWLNSGQPVYEPLLWRLQPVDTCMIHQCKLVECCPRCDTQFTSVTRNGAVGFCPNCNTWLGNHHSCESIEPSSESFQLTKSIGELLALTPDVPQPDPKIITQVIDEIYLTRHELYFQIAMKLQISESRLIAQRNGLIGTNLKALALLGSHYGDILWDALGKRASYLSQHQVFRTTEIKTADQKERFLQQLLDSSDPLPEMINIARNCGFKSVHSLKYFPLQYGRLRTRLIDEQRQALQEILDGDSIMSVSDLARHRGYSTDSLLKRFRELCIQISEAHDERKLRHCRQYLQDLINSNHFPKLTAISTSLVVTQNYLKSHFSAELKYIEAQRQQLVQLQKQVEQNHLNAALASDALQSVSFSELADDLGTSAEALRGRYPIHHGKIIKRRRKYFANQLEAKCQRIRQVVYELHEQDIYPQRAKVSAMTGVWLVTGSVYNAAYIEAMVALGYRR